MKQVLISEELLKQILARLEFGGPEWERDAVIKALCAGLEQPGVAPAPVQEPVANIVKGAIMGAAYDFRDAHISGSTNLKRIAHAALEAVVDAALKTAPVQEPTRFDLATVGSMVPSESGRWVRYEDIPK